MASWQANYRSMNYAQLCEEEISLNELKKNHNVPIYDFNERIAYIHSEMNLKKDRVNGL